MSEFRHGNGKKNFKLSCIVPVHNEHQVIEAFLETLERKLKEITNNYEIIVVDDGSEDNTVSIVEKICEAESKIKLIELSRNFGKEIALTAGIEASDSDAVILIDADFQHPIELISTFVKFWQQGYQMVYGVRLNRDHESYVKRKSAKLFYRFMKYSTGINIPAHAGDFRLIDKIVVDAIKKMPERSRFMKGLYAWVGYKTKAINFEVRERLAGESQWNFVKLVNLALSGITAFSTLPLRLVGVVGLIISLTSFIYAFFIVFKTLSLGVSLPGWPTIMVAITFIGGIQLLSLWVLGEYIAGIFNEVKQRPKYLINRKIGFKKINNN